MVLDKARSHRTGSIQKTTSFQELESNNLLVLAVQGLRFRNQAIRVLNSLIQIAAAIVTANYRKKERKNGTAYLQQTRIRTGDR